MNKSGHDIWFSKNSNQNISQSDVNSYQHQNFHRNNLQTKNLSSANLLYSGNLSENVSQRISQSRSFDSYNQNKLNKFDTNYNSRPVLEQPQQARVGNHIGMSQPATIKPVNDFNQQKNQQKSFWEMRQKIFSEQALQSEKEGKVIKKDFSKPQLSRDQGMEIEDLPNNSYINNIPSMFYKMTNSVIFNFLFIINLVDYNKSFDFN